MKRTESSISLGVALVLAPCGKAGNPAPDAASVTSALDAKQPATGESALASTVSRSTAATPTTIVGCVPVLLPPTA